MNLNFNNNNISIPEFSKDFKNLNEKLKSSKLNNSIISGNTLHQYQKRFVAKTETKTQSEITAKQLDPEMLGTFLNSMKPSFTSEGGRVTAVVAKLRYHSVIKNQTQQRHDHSAGHCTSKKAIKVLLDSGSDGDLMFHGQGTTMHFPY
jgi:hypothetical protein